MRNHGESPWFPSHTYADMANDLAEVIEAFGGNADVLGHSMGGKAAMVLALSRPELVNRLIIADIAPVAYGHSQQQNIDVMRELDLSNITSRADVTLPIDPALQAFFLQSLDLKGKRWKLNLEALETHMPDILGFPELDGVFEQPTLFLSGANSDYVKPADRPGIRALFPAAKFAKIPGAGHWLHAEKPREFEAAVNVFLTTPM